MQRKIETEEEEFKIISVGACSKHHQHWCFDSLSNQTFSCQNIFIISTGVAGGRCEDKVSLLGRYSNQKDS